MIPWLNKDYILEYNLGKGEGLSIFIPNAKGGKADYIGNDEAAMEQADPEYAEQIGKSSHYWGGQKFSGGAIYFGAVAFFLFIIGLVFIKDSLKYPVIFLSIIVMGLSAVMVKSVAPRVVYFEYSKVVNKLLMEGRTARIPAAIKLPLTINRYLNCFSKTKRIPSAIAITNRNIAV